MVEARDSSIVQSNHAYIDGKLRPASILLDAGGRVARIDPAPATAGASVAIYPAPLDLHLHGCGGRSVAPIDAPDDLDVALGAACRSEPLWSADASGAQPYSYLATLPVPSDPPQDIAQHVEEAVSQLARQPAGRCEGIRIEGLFLNPERAGVWPPAGFRAPDIALFDEIMAVCRTAGVPLRILDMACELPGALALIEHAVAAGVVISLAHTDATYEQAQRGIDAGARLATHLFNAMRPLHHREPGVVGAVLDDRRVRVELICDGVHVHPAMMRLVTRAIEPTRVVLISDASPFAACTPGEYEWNGMRIHHHGDRLIDDAGALAGSAITLAAAPRTLQGHGLGDVYAACSVHPRMVLDPARSNGLQVGDDLWFVPHEAQ